MSSRRLRNLLGKVAGVGLVTTVILAMAAPVAFADTSTATANAAALQLAGATLLTTGKCISSNPGPPTVTNVTCNQTPGLGLLGTQTAISAGVLVQQTVARPDGTSAACAGLVGAGGSIQIGASGICTVIGAAPGGVQLNLGLATVHADAILAQCHASSTGAPVVAVQLVNATVALLGGGTTPIISSPPVNDKAVNLGTLVNATFNLQPVPQPSGQVNASALDVTVLSGLPGTQPLVHLVVGTVTCGPNAITPASPAFPLAGTPIALGMLAIAGFVGWRFWWVPRQRVQSVDL